MFDLHAMQEADDRLGELLDRVADAQQRFESTLSETSRLKEETGALVAQARQNHLSNASGGCPMAHRN